MADKAKPMNRNSAFPAKAGRRKVYKGGHRKVKSFEPTKGFMMSYDVAEYLAIVRPSEASVRANLRHIDSVRRNTPVHSISDPFVFDRMRARAKIGLYDNTKPFACA